MKPLCIYHGNERQVIRTLVSSALHLGECLLLDLHRIADAMEQIAKK